MEDVFKVCKDRDVMCLLERETAKLEVAEKGQYLAKQRRMEVIEAQSGGKIF